MDYSSCIYMHFQMHVHVYETWDAMKDETGKRERKCSVILETVNNTCNCHIVYLNSREGNMLVYY